MKQGERAQSTSNFYQCKIPVSCEHGLLTEDVTRTSALCTTQLKKIEFKARRAQIRDSHERNNAADGDVCT